VLFPVFGRLVCGSSIDLGACLPGTEALLNLRQPVRSWKFPELLIAMLIFMLGSGACFAYDDPYFKPFSAELQLWTHGDVYQSERDVFKSYFPAYSDDSSSLAVGGYGLGMGTWLHGPGGNYQVGGTISYVIGPSLDVNISKVDPLSPFNGETLLTHKQTSQFFRFLFEARKDFKISKKNYFRLRGGIGGGHVRVQVNESARGRFNASTFDYSVGYSDSGFDFTWELMPGLVSQGKRMDFELAVGMAGFPKLPSEGRLSEFNWSPVGLKLSLYFKPTKAEYDW
jgi:hypothetical protein